MAFSPDGSVLAVCAGDPSVRLWDAATGKELRQLHGHQFGAYALAFSPDAKTLATGGIKQVRVWDVATGRERARLGDFKRPVFALAYSPDGKALAAAADDGDCRAWDLAGGKELRHFGLLRQKAETGNPISKVGFAPGGKVLAWVAWGNRIHLTDARTGKELLADSGQPDVAHFALSPDRKVLAAPCADGSLRLWDTARGNEIRAWKSGEGPVHLVHFTPDGKTLVTVGKKLRCWDVSSGREQARFDLAPGPILLGPWAVSPDARVLAVGAVNLRGSVGSRPCPITFWDLTTGKKLAVSQDAHKDSVTALAFSPDGKALASTGSDRTLRLWQPATGREERRLDGLAAVASRLAFSPDGRTILGVSTHFDNQGKQALRLVLWETLTLQKRQERDVAPGAAFFLAFSQDTKALAYSDLTGAVHVQDLARGKEVCRFTGQEGDVFNGLFSRDRRLLATGSRAGTILIWDLAGRAGGPGGGSAAGR
jgi:WD40 repeat protein